MRLPAIEVPVPSRSPEEATKPDLPIHIPREQQRTQRGLAPPPPPTSIPPPVRKDSPPPGNLVPLPWSPEAPPSARLPAHGHVSPSVAAAAEKVPLAKWLVIIGAVFTGATGFVMATGQVIVSVLNASRPVTIDNVRREHDDRLKKVEARAAADWGLTSETNARLEHEKRTDEALVKLEERMRSVEGNRAAVIQGLAPKR